MRFLRVILVFSLLWNTCSAQTSVANCPPEGKATDDLTKHTNTLKNRDIIRGKIDSTIVFDSIIRSGKEDTARFKPAEYVSVTGFVLAADEGGPESCNCFSKDSAAENIKLFLGHSLDSWKDSVFVIEITPKFSKLHPEVHPELMIGRKVTITGYVMYNPDAKRFALNVCKNCRVSDRKTAWEICPVTDVKVIYNK
jgi:hypothetical protein